MIKPKLHHVTIKTSRLDEMIAWYGQVIGAQVQFRDQVAACLVNHFFLTSSRARGARRHQTDPARAPAGELQPAQCQCGCADPVPR